MRASLVVILLVAGGCVNDAASPGPLELGVDLSSHDLPLAPSLCTSTACAAQPCTANCVFVAPDPAGCPAAHPSLIGAGTVRACRGFCGLQGAAHEGCLRYRSEDPACPTWCVHWSTASCWERSPQIDYGSGAAICGPGFNCFDGISEDAGGQTCHDAGTD